MDDTLMLADPEHSDAQDAASATARLLMVIHHSRYDRTTDAEPSGDGSLMPAEMADAWAAVYLDVSEKIEAEECVDDVVATANPENNDFR